MIRILKRGCIFFVLGSCILSVLATSLLRNDETTPVSSNRAKDVATIARLAATPNFTSAPAKSNNALATISNITPSTAPVATDRELVQDGISDQITASNQITTAELSTVKYVCPDRDMNLRAGPGYSEFEQAGQIYFGERYTVIGEAQGENVFGNTTWYLIDYDGETAYATGHYAQPCDEQGQTLVQPSSPSQVQQPQVQQPQGQQPQVQQPQEVYDTRTSCTELKSRGQVPAGGWPRGHAMYTSRRDRDGDGWACE